MKETEPSRGILVVGAERENLEALRRELEPWLSQRGVSLDLCASGEEALELMRRSAYAVLLTDNRMPGMSGAELVKEVGRRYPTTVSMMLTGTAEKRDIEDALGSGIFAFMKKPWERDLLRREIENALQASHTRSRHLESNLRMSQELRLAVEFQKRLFSLELPTIENGIAPSYVQRAAGKLGVLGDYLDIVTLSDTSYLVLLGDVSGHGLRTTLVSAMLKSVLTPEYIAERGADTVSPAALLSWLNRRLVDIAQNIPDLFIAFSALLVDCERLTVTASSAGTPLPLLQRGDLIEPVESYGVVLGVNSDAVYEDTVVTMRPGDALFLFTDGVQLFRRGRHRADTDTLYQAILRSRHQEPVDRVVDRLRSASEDEALGDDITLVRLTSN